MRIWDLYPQYLCRQHLLGEHRELHALWSIVVHNKKGFSRHPETLRWVGKLPALYLRHRSLVIEMTNRGYKHKTDLSLSGIVGSYKQDVYLQAPHEQISILKDRCSDCRLLLTL